MFLTVSLKIGNILMSQVILIDWLKLPALEEVVFIGMRQVTTVHL